MQSALTVSSGALHAQLVSWSCMPLHGGPSCRLPPPPAAAPCPPLPLLRHALPPTTPPPYQPPVLTPPCLPLPCLHRRSRPSGRTCQRCAARPTASASWPRSLSSCEAASCEAVWRCQVAGLRQAPTRPRCPVPLPSPPAAPVRFCFALCPIPACLAPLRHAAPAARRLSCCALCGPRRLVAALARRPGPGKDKCTALAGPPACFPHAAPTTSRRGRPPRPSFP